MTSRLLVVSWAPLHSATCLVQLLSFSLETCPAHWCLLVWIWWIMSMTPVFKQIALALFLLCSVSTIIIHSILHCVVTIFLQLCFAEGPFFTPYLITGSMHSLYTFIFNLGVIHLFCVIESSLPKQSNQGLFCISTLVLDHDLLSPSDWGRCSCQLLWSSFHWCWCHFVNYRIAHDLSLS